MVDNSHLTNYGGNEIFIPFLLILFKLIILAKKTQKQVFVSCNLSSQEADLLPQIEQKLLQILISDPDIFA